MDDFYARTVTQLLDRHLLRRDMQVLVVCGGEVDRDVFHGLGFPNVTITNLDSHGNPSDFAPFPWSPQDAENLTCPDGSFDFVVAHSGLHHCSSPHRALLEMYRVARCGVLVFEPRDTLLVRLGVRLNFGQEYEVAAVAAHGLKFGGVRNSAIPNYVYRWSEREIEKTLSAYDPLSRPRIHYFYALRVPQGRLDMMKRRSVARCVQMLLPFLRVFTAIFPRQCNNFAWAVEKQKPASELFPWLELVNGQPAISSEWVRQHYSEQRNSTPS